MHRMNVIAVAAVVTLGFLVGFGIPASAQSVTAFEGARLIVGDGRVIENATLVVEGARIAQVGGKADVRVPNGARRVDLAGKTVMPMIVDTHTHLSTTRDGLIRDLKQRAYFGVSATRNSAGFVRMTDAGTLEAGMSADFIVLDANPLDDITNTREKSYGVRSLLLLFCGTYTRSAR